MFHHGRCRVYVTATAADQKYSSERGSAGSSGRPREYEDWAFLPFLLNRLAKAVTFFFFTLFNMLWQISSQINSEVYFSRWCSVDTAIHMVPIVFCFFCFVFCSRLTTTVFRLPTSNGFEQSWISEVLNVYILQRGNTHMLVNKAVNNILYYNCSIRKCSVH